MAVEMVAAVTFYADKQPASKPADCCYIAELGRVLHTDYLLPL
jgi:NADH:ubiquinone oxidoreductase subunit 6 (subunit J)